MTQFLANKKCDGRKHFLVVINLYGRKQDKQVEILFFYIITQ